MNEMQLHHIAVTGALKATPATEGEERFVYFEASNEAVDQQGETVLAKALKESSPYYLKYGNIDLDHITQLGARSGLSDYHFFEVGRPVEVEVSRRRTFVKGMIFRGQGKAAEKANAFWSSITGISPPQRWYPSIGGSVMAKAVVPGANGKATQISRVRWTNVGLSKTPVNQDVPEVSCIPIGDFAKAWTPDGLDLAKALVAGYGTNSAGLTGGGALRRQSIEGHPLSYWDFRNRVSRDIRTKSLSTPSGESIAAWAVQKYGMGRALASEWCDRFLYDLSTNLQQARSTR